MKDINFKKEAKNTIKRLQTRQVRVHKQAELSRRTKRSKLNRKRFTGNKVNSLVFGLTTSGAQRADSVGTEQPKNAVLVSLKEHGPMSVRQISKQTDIDRVKVIHILNWAKRPDHNYVTVVSRESQYEEDY